MNDWIEHRLGDIADIQTGPFGSQLHQHDYVSEGTPLITVKNLGENKVTYNKLDFVSEVDRNRLIKFVLKEGDIVFSRVGYVDRRAYITKKEAGWMFSGSTLRVRVIDNNAVDRKYLSYFFGQNSFREEIKRISVGATRPSLNTSLLEELTILAPPLPEQKAIASILSALDDKIDLLHRQNQTLEALAQTFFHQWFIEEAEDGWEMGNLPDEFDFVMGLSPPGKSYNEEGLGTPMFQGKADFQFRFPHTRVFTTDPRRSAKKFDTLISVRAPVGAQNMASQKCCIGRGVAAFRYRENPEFYSYTYYKMHSLMNEIRVFEDTGTVFGSINKGNFEGIEISIPPKELIGKFQEIVNPIDQKIFQNFIQIDILEKLRDLLLPKLMNGDVRVCYDPDH